MTPFKRLLIIWLLIGFAGAAASPALAHTRSQSFSQWQYAGNEARMVFAVDARRVTQLSQLDEDNKTLTGILDAHLRASVRLSQSGVPCPLAALSVTGDTSVTLHARARFICPQAIEEMPPDVVIESFQIVSPTHIHIARIRADAESSEFALHPGAPEFTLSVTQAPKTIPAFIRYGFDHVLSGADHLVFLLALLLAARSMRMAILCVTGFTVGHSLTLALASLGIITPNGPVIEALIGLTIALAALEAATQRGFIPHRQGFLAMSVIILAVFLLPPSLQRAAWPAALGLFVFAGSLALAGPHITQRLMPVLTAAFGLIHGAGFAGGLQEMNILRQELLAPLLGFNIGVELGQLLALLVMSVSLLALSQLHKKLRLGTELFLPAIVLLVGIYWFAVRIWGV